MMLVRSSLIAVKCAAVAAIVFTVAAIWLFGVDRNAIASASGPAPGNTNAPGEANCTACHTSYTVNSGEGAVAISGIPLNYRPGVDYPVTVTTSQKDGTIYGFQMTAVDSLGRQAGTFTPEVQNPPQTQVDTGNIGGIERKYIEHTIDGVLPTLFGSKSWNFTWTAPTEKLGKIDFYAAGNAANSDGSTGGDYIYTTSESTLSGSAISNFNGDLRSDIAVFRPSTGIWYSYDLSSGSVISDQFGASNDRIVPGDYDADGKTDFAVFRPSTGVWYIWKSTDGITVFNFGLPGDIPAPGDYDGDGKTDIAIFRPANGTWYIDRSTEGLAIFLFGLDGDTPVQGDYDADGKTDIALFRPSNGIWYLMQSTAASTAVQFGAANDKPVQNDFDGDGKTDIAIFRATESAWYILNSSTGSSVTIFGLSDDIPAPADYDADGKTDIAVFRPSNGLWFLLNSSDSTVSVWFFGSNGDIPVAAGYIPE